MACFRRASVAGLVVALAVAGAVQAEALDEAPPALKELAGYDFGDESGVLLEVREAVVGALNDGRGEEAERWLLAVLNDLEASWAAQQHACRMLSIVGSEASVEPLAELLRDPKRADIARYALERIEGEAAVEALRDAMDELEGQSLEGVIGSIGQRRDKQAVDRLHELAEGDDEVVARAAIHALGRIGTTGAVDALATLAEQVGDAREADLVAAGLSASKRLVDAGETAFAADIFQRVYEADVSAAARGAALHGLLQTRDVPELTATLVKVLQGEPTHERELVIRRLRVAEDPAVRDAVAEQIGEFDDGMQAELLDALTEQAEPEMRAVVLDQLEQSEAEAVRVAAIEALQPVGEPRDVAMLIERAEAGAAEANAAVRTLGRMRHEGTNGALIDLAETGGTRARVVAVEALVERGADEALPTLTDLVASSQQEVRVAALRGLEALGDVQQLQTAVDALVRDADGPTRQAANGAMRAMMNRAADEAEASRIVRTGLAEAESDAARVALVRALPLAGDEAALEALTAVIDESDEAMRNPAIRALADWPNLNAADRLLGLAEESADSGHRVLALRSYIRLVNSAAASDRERVRMLETAIATAERPDEKRLALSGLAQVPSGEALAIVRDHTEDPELRNEAASALVTLSGPLGSDHAEALREALETVDVDELPEGLADRVRQAKQELAG